MRLPSATAIPLDTAQAMPRAKIEHAARELETQFAQMLLKSMRSASLGGDALFGNDTTYRDMYDQQLARELGKGPGLGLAPMIVRQLERSTGAATTSATLPSGGLPLRADAAAQALPLSAMATLPTTTLPLAASSSGTSLPALAPLPPPPVPEPTPTAECDPDAPLDCSSPEAFVRSIWPHAQRTADELGVSPRALVAQAALETGWGRRLAGDSGRTSHNLFGIKASSRWSGARVSSGTHEFVGGVRVSQRADFRAYGSVQESFADYARLLRNERYAGALAAGGDETRFASALQRAGYATDPRYAAKISAIADGATMQRALASLPAAAQRG
jgi:flagellar protein FlgJ